MRVIWDIIKISIMAFIIALNVIILLVPDLILYYTTDVSLLRELMSFYKSSVRRMDADLNGVTIEPPDTEIEPPIEQKDTIIEVTNEIKLDENGNKVRVSSRPYKYLDQ